MDVISEGKEKDALVLLDASVWDNTFLDRTYAYRTYEAIPMTEIEKVRDTTAYLATLYSEPNVFTTKAVFEEMKRTVDISAGRLRYYNRHLIRSLWNKRVRKIILEKEPKGETRSLKRVSVSPIVYQGSNLPAFEKIPKRKTVTRINKHPTAEAYETMVDEMRKLHNVVSNRIIRPPFPELYGLLCEAFSHADLLKHLENIPSVDDIPRPYKREYEDLNGDASLLSMAYCQVLAGVQPVYVISSDKRMGRFFADSKQVVLSMEAPEGYAWNAIIGEDVLKFYVTDELNRITKVLDLAYFD